MGTRQIEDLVEAQYHFLESRRPEEAAEVIDFLLEPLFEAGRFPDLVHIVEQVLDAIPRPSSRLMIFHARSLSNLGRHEEALAELELIELGLRNNWVLLAAVLIDKANAMRRVGDISAPEDIISNYRRAFELYESGMVSEEVAPDEKLVYRKNQANCLFNEAAISLYFLENFSDAIDKFLQALRIFQEVKSEEGVGLVYKELGEIYGLRRFKELYNPSLSRDYFAQALAKFDALGLLARRFETLYELAKMEGRDSEISLGLFRECQQIARTLGLLREEAIANRYLAEVELLQYERTHRPHQPASDADAFYRRTIDELGRSAKILAYLKSDIWSRRVLADCCYLQGRLSLKIDAIDTAAGYFRASLDVSKERIVRGRPIYDTERRVKAVLRLLQIQFSRGFGESVGELLADSRADFSTLGIERVGEDNVNEIIQRLESVD